MMTHDNKELKMLDQAAAEFAKKALAPGREENDKFPFGPFFQETLEKAYALDFFHLILPEEFKGMGQGTRALGIVLENICQADSSLGGILLTCTAAQEILLAADARDLLRSIMEKAAGVNQFLIALPVFADPLENGVAVTAKPEGESFLLNGDLEFLVLGGLAGHAVIPALTPDQKGYSLFLADLGADGVVKSDPVFSLGMHACPAVDISFRNVAARLVGEPGKGAVYFEKMTDRLSAAAAAMALGVMKGSLGEALDYARKRTQGGRVLVQWSEIKKMLADMAITVKCAEMLVSQSCAAVDDQEHGWAACARAAALKTAEMACELTSDGIQVMGGVGYMKDFGQEKRFRDARHIQALFGMTPLKKLHYMEKFIQKI